MGFFCANIDIGVHSLGCLPGPAWKQGKSVDRAVAVRGETLISPGVKKMKMIIPVLLVVVATLAGRGQAATYGDTEEAFQDCRLFLELGRELTVDESIRANSCVNFVVGAWDMGEYLSWRDVFLGKEPAFCPPEEEIDVAKAILAFINYLEEHPEQMEHRLAMVLELSFKNAYPCTEGPVIKLAN